MKSLRSLLLEKEMPSFKQRLKGGLADKVDPSQFNQKELMKGIHIEFEHTNDVLTALEVASDHLVENPKYYTDLEKFEAGEE